MKDLISVIIPVYNKEKYILKCVKSVLENDFKNLEIIIVNDGSTDNSQKICEKLMSHDKRISILNKKNEGVELARLSGILHATGNYIMFIDSDDWIPKNSISLLYNRIKNCHADICIGNITRFIDKYGIIKQCTSNDIYNYKIIDSNSFIDNYLNAFYGNGYFPLSIHSKLFKTNLFKDIKTVGISYGEDLCLLLQAIINAKKIASIPQTVLFYRWGGITTFLKPEIFFNAIKLYQFKTSFLTKLNKEEFLCYANDELVSWFYALVECLLELGMNDDNISKQLVIALDDKTFKSALKNVTTIMKTEIKYIYIIDRDIENMIVYCRKEFKKQRLRKKIFYLISKM